MQCTLAVCVTDGSLFTCEDSRFSASCVETTLLNAKCFELNNFHPDIPSPIHYFLIIMSINIIFFSVALRPNAVHGHLILEVSRSHTTTPRSR